MPGDGLMPCLGRRWRVFTFGFLILAGLPLPASAAAPGQPRGTEEAEPIDMTVLFIRDPLVQKELKLGADQSRGIEQLLEESDGTLFRTRNLPARQYKTKADAVLAEIDKELDRFLQPQQRLRFDQITLRTRGLSGFLQPKSIEALQLTPGQCRRIGTLILASQQGRGGRDASGKRVVRGADDEDGRPGLNEILAVLSDEQRQKWRVLLGPGFDVTRLRPLAFKAPEFREVDAWLNAKPMTLADLRGQVVLVHFWTFDCGNCIKNYPAYRNLQDAYARKGVTFVGIHTPETEGERDVDAVRRKATENKLTFPIAVDNGKYNWEAWGNQVWPSIYLVDKHGFVRFWWYGELGGRGSNGERILKARLDALLAEKEPQPASKPAH